MGCALHTPIHTYTVLCYVSTPTSSFHKLTLTELCTNNPFSYNLASYDRADLMQTIFQRVPLVRFYYCAKTEDIFWERRGFAWVTLQIILELCIPEKELANTRSQISFIYFQSHSWYSVRNYKIPKRIMKIRFEPRLPRMLSWKKIHILDLTGPLYM